MKKYTIQTILLLMLSWVLPQIHRYWGMFPVKYINPFLWAENRDGTNAIISVQWYAKDIGELLSFSCLMLTVSIMLTPVIKHFRSILKDGYNGLLVFTVLWQRLFLIIFWTSILDFVHYIIAFRQIEYYFLIINVLYFSVSAFFILKLWKR